MKWNQVEMLLTDEGWQMFKEYTQNVWCIAPIAALILNVINGNVMNTDRIVWDMFVGQFCFNVNVFVDFMKMVHMDHISSTQRNKDEDES